MFIERPPPLIHGTLSPTVLYACEAWTLTQELENRLRRTQRQMLRMILHAPRRTTNTQTPQRLEDADTTTQRLNTTQPNHHISDTDDSDSDVDSSPNTPQKQQPPTDASNDPETFLEPWSDWIKRCTREAETRMNKLRLDDWVTMQRRRKWRWIPRLITCDQKWTTSAIHWDPYLDTKLNAQRRPGRPKTRWMDDIRTYLQHHFHRQPKTTHDLTWEQLAKDTYIWDTLEDGYVNHQPLTNNHHQQPTSNHQSPIINHQPPITDQQSTTNVQQSPTTLYQLPTTNH